MAIIKKTTDAKSTKEDSKIESKATKDTAKTEKKTTTKKATSKKAPAKKPTTKPATKKENVAVQFAGKEFDVDAIVESAKADFKANNKGCLRSIKVYIKPEDNAAYYVVNGKIEGKVSL